MKDIEGITDIKRLVNEFYKKVRADDMLAPIFAIRMAEDWQPHLETMYRFWNATLFGVREYAGNPFRKHAALPLDARHFEQWINLFYATRDCCFAGEVASQAKRKAIMMAHTFYVSIKKHNHPLPDFPRINRRGIPRNEDQPPGQ